MLSLSFDIGGLLTGTLLILNSDVIRDIPWALILFPGILSIRGAIGGLFSGHLSTGLHLGTIRANFTKNTKDFYLLLQAVIALALISGIAVGIGTSIFGIFLWKATAMNFVELLAVIIATMSLSVVFNTPITIAFSVLSFRRGLDPDVIVYPIASTVSDIINTACFIFSLNLFFTLNHVGYFSIGILNLIFFSIVAYILARNIREERFFKMIREFLLTLIFITIIVNVTGSFLEIISEKIGNRSDLYTRIAFVYPALITTIGGVGSIIGSTTTTKLALGLIEPSFSSIKKHFNEIIGSWIASMVMFTLYSLSVFFMIQPMIFGDLLRFIAQLLATNILAVSAMVVITFIIAIATYRRGLDPDNFVIPLESSLADSVTTLSLLLALIIII